MPDHLFETVLASTVHEMKNSLGLLMNQLDELGAELPAASAGRLSAIQYEASRINTSLMEMLALYKIDNQQLDVAYDEVVVIELIEDCVASFLPLAESRRIAIDIDCDDQLMGFFDANLVGIAIANIVGNSIRYARARIRVSARPEAGGLLLRIEDDGDGYPEAMLDEVAAFGHGVDIGSGSTGLGLFFAHTLAGVHRRGERSGEIRIANGGGLPGGCFEMRLP